ncbi:MAG: hypothetical protein V2I63_00400 [Pseudomonadales bacterium]|nr:hypothetical protein [Pseudomonadales bacterium]
MDWGTYRRLCDRGDVLSRHLLDATAGRLREAGECELADRLSALTAAAPIARPADHRGGPEADFFQVALGPQDARRVLAIVGAPRSPAANGGTPHAHRVVWQEYVDWIEGRHPRAGEGWADPEEQK